MEFQRYVGDLGQGINAPHEDVNKLFRTDWDWAITGSDVAKQCYGTICEVKVQALVNSHGYISPELLASNTEEFHRTFHVVPQSSNLVLKSEKDSDSKAIGVLNMRSANGFMRVAFLPSIYLEAVLTKGLSPSEAQRRLDRSHIVLTVAINIYGPANDGDQIGEILSDSRMYLQRPLFKARGVTYRNPQWWSPKYSQPDAVGANIPTDTEESLSDDPASIGVDEFLDSIPQQEALSEREVDTSLVKTPLKRHQKEGLDFMLKKELGQTPLSSRLWREERSNTGSLRYRHKITGSTDPSPPDEPKSGLIADLMGLGKSLTTLALIVSSLSRAKSFASNSSDFSQFVTPRKSATHATLVIVPNAILIDEWFDEIESHLSVGSLKFHRYHGPSREIDHTKLNSFDVIFTTYSTVETEFFRGRQFLSSIRWFRVVFDEAHVVRNVDTRQFKAASALEAEHKWCLTGTPIQNKAQDIQALVILLQVPKLEEKNWFNWSIIRPIKPDAKDAFENLRCLLSSICLRRARSVANLFDPEEYWPLVTFTPQEQEVDQRMIDNFQKSREIARRHGDIKTLRQLVFRQTLRRRIFCNTGASEMLELNGNYLNTNIDEHTGQLEQDIEVCCLCSHETSIVSNDEQFSDTSLYCGHVLCDECKMIVDGEYMNEGSGIQFCPLCVPDCGDPSLLAESKPSKITTGDYTAGVIPSKLLVVVGDLLKHKGIAKSLVFSSWIKSLDALAAVALEHNIVFTRLDGTMSVSERRKSRQKFEQDPEVDAMLVTIGTGAMGLNVPAANRIHILEPQWNPAMESQAIGRAVRMGKIHNVVVVRYIVRGSIEEMRVKQLQQEKIKLATESFGESMEDREAQLQKEIDLACWRRDTDTTSASLCV